MENKLRLFGIITESLSIPFKNPYFIIFTFLTSLPYFSLSIFHETLLQQTLIETGKIIQQHFAVLDDLLSMDSDILQVILELVKEISHKFLLLGLLYLGILHFLYLFSIIATVQIASMVHQGEKKNFTDLLKRLIRETKFKGPLITSIQVLLLEALMSIGLVSFGPYMYITMTYIFFMVVFSLVFISLFIKYLEWSGVWDLSIVISVLDEKKYGDVALVISSFLTRDSRNIGLILVMFFFALRVVLRLWSFHLGWNIGASRVFITTVQVGFVTMANVLKWLMFVVYFYDCEKRSSRKAVEEGRTEEQLIT